MTVEVDIMAIIWGFNTTPVHNLQDEELTLVTLALPIFPMPYMSQHILKFSPLSVVCIFSGHPEKSQTIRWKKN